MSAWKGGDSEYLAKKGSFIVLTCSGIFLMMMPAFSNKLGNAYLHELPF